MTFTSWVATNTKKKKIILDKLKGVTVAEIAEYFEYDNMVQKEPKYCPLYSTKTKCHNIDKLNCFFCACPHFVFSDTNSVATTDTKEKVMSVCGINSQYAKTYKYGGKIQCDCSDCTLPHTKEYVIEYLHNMVKAMYTIEDSCSFLEHLRAYQLQNILGKYKLF